MKFLMLFMVLVFASEHNPESNKEQSTFAPILVKIEEDEYAKVTNTSTHSHTSALTMLKFGGLKTHHYSPKPCLVVKSLQNNINSFERKKSSQYIGVFYNDKKSRWIPQIWSKKEKKLIFNGCYKDEETAAHASDTLVRKCMANGEQNHKLNFPNDRTEVYPEEVITTEYLSLIMKLDVFRNK